MALARSITDAELEGRPEVFGAALLAITLWAFTLVATKHALLAIDGVALGVLRSLLPALVAAPYLAFRRAALPRGRRQRLYLALSAALGFVIFPIGFSLGLRFTSASHAALILACLPVFSGMVAFIFARRWPRGLWWVGVALAVAGETLLLFKAGASDGQSSLLGDFFIFIACIAAATGYWFGADVARSMPAWHASLWSTLLGSLIVLPILPFVLPGAGLAEAGPTHWAAILYCGLVATLIAYVAWYWALAKGGVARVGPLQFAQPLIALFFAWALLAEPIGPNVLLAAPLIFIGVYLSRRG